MTSSKETRMLEELSSYSLAQSYGGGWCRGRFWTKYEYFQYWGSRTREWAEGRNKRKRKWYSQQAETTRSSCFYNEWSLPDLKVVWITGIRLTFLGDEEDGVEGSKDHLSLDGTAEAKAPQFMIQLKPKGIANVWRKGASEKERRSEMLVQERVLYFPSVLKLAIIS